MKSVLIIDDENTDAKLLAYLIAKRSPVKAQTQICDSVDNASFQLQGREAGYVFLNLELPGAVEFLLQSRKAGLPVVATISHTSEALLAVRLLGVDYLFRPFVPEQVSAYLNADKWKTRLSVTQVI